MTQIMVPSTLSACLCDGALRLAARFPIVLKRRFFLRSAGFVRRKFCTDELRDVTTNLGICSSYRITFKHPAENTYLFGRPECCPGESGALFLSRLLMNKCSAFVDIGAHRGYFTFFVREGHIQGKPIFFFEPNPELFC